MRQISLQYVEVENFKSFVSARVDLACGPGLRMIFGENREEPRLGANGAGKSMCVETGWLVDGELRTIKRTFPPEKVYLDGKLSDQSAVDELMGLSRDRFLASVVFGQDRPLFVDLPVPERGDLLDEVLGLSYWMRAADLATSKWNQSTIKMQRLQQEIARLDGALAEQPREEDLKTSIVAYEDRRTHQINELREQRRPLDVEYKRLRRLVNATRVDVDAELAANKLHSELRDRLTAQSSEVAVLRSEARRLDNDVKSFPDTGECPTCGQEITAEFADKHLCELRMSYNKAQNLLIMVETAAAVTVSALADAGSNRTVLAERLRDQHRLELAVASKRGELSTINNRMQLILDQVNPYEAQLAAAKERRVDLLGQLSGKREEESVLSARMGHLDFWRQGFRRVRMFCLTRVLSELEVETMGAARSLGLVGWHIKFSGETETKSGTVKLGIQAVVQSPVARRDFDSWSPGEGQRIRCASALGLASLIQRHSGVSYDLEVWDEPSAWLSAEGIDDLFECLRERAYARNKAIWVVDPRAGLSHGGFEEVWNVVKDANGSRIDIARAQT